MKRRIVVAYFYVVYYCSTQEVLVVMYLQRVLLLALAMGDTIRPLQYSYNTAPEMQCNTVVCNVTRRSPASRTS
jgi:hypothetical protein